MEPSDCRHCSKRKRCDDEEFSDDKCYFRAYSDISIHQEMIGDEVRTNTYRQAILRNYKKIYGKVVVDVGAGTGILSLFCVQAGAKQVYAIEASDISRQAELVIEANDCQHRVTVIHGRVEDVELPEKVDVIVSEWMGYMLVYESMLSSVLCARDKWLKEDGILLPSIAELFMAPITDPDLYQDRVGFWDDVKSRYNVDMSVLKGYSLKCMTQSVQVESVCTENIVARPCSIARFDLRHMSAQQLSHIQSAFSFDYFGDVTLHGFVFWFKVTFPCNTVLSTSPYDKSTHWLQSVVYLSDDHVKTRQGDDIHGSVSITPNTRHARYLDVHVSYSVNDSTVHNRASYTMNDFIN